MGPWLGGAAGLMWGHVVVAGSGPGGGLGASRLPPWGTVGRGRQLRRFAPAAWGLFGLGADRGLILFREVNDLIWSPEALAFFDCYVLRFYGLKVWMLQGFVFTRSLLGKVLELGWQGYRSGVDALCLFRLIGETVSLK